MSVSQERHKSLHEFLKSKGDFIKGLSADASDQSSFENHQELLTRVVPVAHLVVDIVQEKIKRRFAKRQVIVSS